MKMSEISINEVAAYLRLDEDEYSQSELNVFLQAAKAYIRLYTGLDDSVLDNQAEVIPVVYILCQDFNDNRSLYVESQNVNRVVDNILNYLKGLSEASPGGGGEG